MDSINGLIKEFKNNPQNVRFSDLHKVCECYFGAGRQKGSHIIFKTPWIGDPRINIQDDNGKAKAYQVNQVLKAILKLEAQNGN
jgi:hypothetical protein